MKSGLFILHLRGSTNGAKVVSKLISERYSSENDIIDIATSYGPSNGKLSAQKVVESILFCLQVIYKSLVKKYTFIYYSITPHGFAFYRDVASLLIIKSLTAKKITLHFHVEIKNNFLVKALKKINFFKEIFAICINQSQKERLVLLTGIPAEHIRVIPNRILPCKNIDFLSKHENISQKIRRHRKIILCISNFLEGKGIEDTVSAYLEIRNNHPSSYLIIAGNIVDEAYFKKIMKKIDLIDPNRERIKVFINLKGKAKEKALKHASVLLFPSKLPETFGLVNLEALEAGLAIISYKTPSSHYFIDEKVNGYTADSVEGLAKHLEYILSQPSAFESMMRSSLEKSKKFDTEIFFKELESALSL
ncbi:hypothetical protein DK254_25700 [Pseudomonas sp. RW407]|uniref:glycosyltransferase family 4 protein n=1 Tax=Pseudomonas sp. RW407 TaxID=2202894 RepID=UPI000D6FD01E|nr:glycosyltransferase family 4 protein [Pseudomonas sp. RW407]PWU26011.1 hypothetical protein DK254_25700 [Pseudomonas sp. RW407]